MKRVVLIGDRKYHLVKAGRIWYAQWLVDGKRKTKTTGQTSQEAAARVIRSWPEESGSMQPLIYLRAYLARQERRRGPLAAQTVYEHEHHAKRIAERFGDRMPSAPEFEDWLYSLEVSNRYRRSIAGTLRIIATEMQRAGELAAPPPVELPPKDSRKPEVFTEAQLRRLFGSDDPWRWPPEERWIAPMMRSLFAAMVFGGLRPQEARALHDDQILWEERAILVTRQITGTRTISDYLKTGSVRDPKYRATVLSEFGWAAFSAWKREGLMYSLDGRPLRREFVRERLKHTCEALGMEGRYTPYSGRYTFVSRYKPIVDGQILMSLTGHVDPAMPERYSVPHLRERVKQLSAARELLTHADANLHSDSVKPSEM
jgi:integrase